MSPSNEPSITERDIEENEAAIRELTELILSGESVALVGSGVSAACGFPTWPRLLEMLSERAQALDPGWDAEAACESLMAEAGRIHNCIKNAAGPEAFADELGAIFRAVELEMDQRGGAVEELGTGDRRAVAPRGLSTFHLQLAELPFRGFLTTNYDHVIERALVESGRCGGNPTAVSVWGDDPLLVSQATRELAVADSVNHVIHLHGDYRQWRTVVLTEEQYKAAYGLDHKRKPRLFHLLIAVLMTRRLVFVGFSLTDEIIDNMLSLVSKLSWQWGEPIHFAVLPRREESWPEDKKRAKRLSSELGVKVVFYESRPGDHSELHVLIDRIHDAYLASHAVHEVPRPAQPAADQVPPDWVRRTNRNSRAELIDDED